MADSTQYLRTAATNLRQAIAVKQQEIAQLQREIDELTRSKQDEVKNLRQEMGKRQSAVTLPDPSQYPDSSVPSDRGDLTREIVQLNNQAIDTEHQIMRLRQDKQKEIDQRNRDVADLQQKAAQLDSTS